MNSNPKAKRKKEVYTIGDGKKKANKRIKMRKEEVAATLFASVEGALTRFYEEPELLEKYACQSLKKAFQKCFSNPDRFSCVPVNQQTVKRALELYDGLSKGFVAQLMAHLRNPAGNFPFLAPFTMDKEATKPRLLVLSKMLMK